MAFSQSTTVSLFTDSVADFLRRSVLPVISNYVSSKKGVSLTVEELERELAMPVRPPTPHIAPSPALATSLYTPTVNTTAPPPSRAKASQLAAPGEPSCIYIYRRGENRDKPCGKKVIVGTDLCRYHTKKTPEGTVGTRPQLAVSQPAAKNVINPVVQEMDEIVAEAVPDGSGRLCIKDTGIIIEDRNGEVFAMSVYDNGQERYKFTEQEVKVCTNLGIKLDTKAEEETYNTHPTTNGVIAQTNKFPVVPGLNAMENYSTIKGNGVLTNSNIGMSSLPSLAN